ncbi:MAG: FAD-dependent oxidoreductase, partial [Oscillospiraceae bacterium]|nr:FAD-dependent oxidoreductase [Oscillospiraceae bacterium]
MSTPETFDAIIIGAGPAGIFTALELTALQPQARVLMVDTGRAIVNRFCPARATGHCAHCVPCAIVHGWAGAGAFSDGKLSLSDEVGGHVADYLGRAEAQALIRRADEIYLRFGASTEVHGLDNQKVDDIAYQATRYNIRLVPCPVRHLGTECAGQVLGGMHDHLVNHTRTQFRELTDALDMLVRDGRAVGVRLRGKDG